MPLSGYPDAAVKCVQSQGWTSNFTELREGAYVVAGKEIDFLNPSAGGKTAESQPI